MTSATVAGFPPGLCGTAIGWTGCDLGSRLPGCLQGVRITRYRDCFFGVLVPGSQGFGNPFSELKAFVLNLFN